MICYMIQIYSGITSGRVLDVELLYTEILEHNLFAFAYILFHDCDIVAALSQIKPSPQFIYDTYLKTYSH